MSNPLAEKTKKTAALYFKDVRDEKPFELWRAFDKDLARDMSLFITGQMYAREKIPHKTRQLVTISALTVLSRLDELRLHIQAALNEKLILPAGYHIEYGGSYAEQQKAFKELLMILISAAPACQGSSQAKRSIR